MRYVLLLVMLCFTSQAFSQKIRFTDKRNNWYTAGSYPDCSFRKHYFYYGPDSIINGMQYARLNCWVTPGTPWCNSNTTVTFIREDSLAGKVYYVDLARDTIEHILYDYTLNVDDSFVHSNSFYFVHDSVTRVDTVAINGINHKVQSLRTAGSIYCRYVIVEGVGCLSGPITVGAAPGCIFEYDEELKCFQQDTTTPSFVVHKFDCYCSPDSFNNAAACGKLLSVPANHTAATLVVLPNPACDKMTISGMGSNSVNHITAVNCLGIKILTVDAIGKDIDLDCSRWPNGIYFIIVSDDRSYVTGKVVVQH